MIVVDPSPPSKCRYTRGGGAVDVVLLELELLLVLLVLAVEEELELVDAVLFVEDELVVVDELVSTTSSKVPEWIIL